MATLYVTEQGARIEKEYKRLLVTLEGEVIQSVPLRSLTEVVLVGTCGATTQAMLSLLDEDIGLTFISQAGKLRGRLRPASTTGLELRLKQYARQNENDFCMNVARAIALGKIKNYRTMARRIICAQHKNKNRSLIKLLIPNENSSRISEAEKTMQQLNEIITQLETAESIDILRGLEGMGSKLYFSIYRAGLRWEGDKGFVKRQRRPPKDPINALLGFGYTLLSQSMITAVELAGLDPLAGFMHTNQYGRPSLALDLMEEFRPIIVDSIVLRMVNQHMIKPGQFDMGEGGRMILSRKGLKIFFNQYHQRINTLVIHPRAGRKLTYQKCFEVQASHLRKVITGEEPAYIPMVWK